MQACARVRASGQRIARFISRISYRQRKDHRAISNNDNVDNENVSFPIEREASNGESNFLQKNADAFRKILVVELSSRSIGIK
jgi:hypothetical protein